MKKFLFAVALTPMLFLGACDPGCGGQGQPACVPKPPPVKERVACYLPTGDQIFSPWGSSAVVKQGGGYVIEGNRRIFDLDGAACRIEQGTAAPVQADTQQ